MGLTGRWVVHLDLDSFFASAEQLTRPTLRGRAVLVGGLGPRGIVAGASGEAKASGARSAMPMAQARRRCPHAVALPGRTAVYRALSETFFAVVRSRAPVLEQVAYDETFAEPAALVGASEEEVHAWSEEVRGEVRARTGLAVSVGAGSGKQVAKIASGLAKPDGVHVVAHGSERALLDPLPVRALWGIGPVAETTLARAGVTTVAALAALDLAEVTVLLGSAVGTGLHRLAQGIDDRAVTERGEAKQVSAETTFDTDLSDVVAVRRAVAELAGSAHRRLVASGRAARTVTVKVRGGDFATHTRSETTAVASTDLPRSPRRPSGSRWPRCPMRGCGWWASPTRGSRRPCRAHCSRTRRSARAGRPPPSRTRTPAARGASAPSRPSPTTTAWPVRNRPPTRRGRGGPGTTSSTPSTATAGCRAPGTGGSPCASRPARRVRGGR